MASRRAIAAYLKYKAQNQSQAAAPTTDKAATTTALSGPSSPTVSANNSRRGSFALGAGAGFGSSIPRDVIPKSTNSDGGSAIDEKEEKRRQALLAFARKVNGTDGNNNNNAGSKTFTNAGEGDADVNADDGDSGYQSRGVMTLKRPVAAAHSADNVGSSAEADTSKASANEAAKKPVPLWKQQQLPQQQQQRPSPAFQSPPRGLTFQADGGDSGNTAGYGAAQRERAALLATARTLAGNADGKRSGGRRRGGRGGKRKGKGKKASFKHSYNPDRINGAHSGDGDEGGSDASDRDQSSRGLTSAWGFKPTAPTPQLERARLRAAVAAAASAAAAADAAAARREVVDAVQVDRASRTRVPGPVEALAQSRGVALAAADPQLQLLAPLGATTEARYTAPSQFDSSQSQDNAGRRGISRARQRLQLLSQFRGRARSPPAPVSRAEAALLELERADRLGRARTHPRLLFH